MSESTAAEQPAGLVLQHLRSLKDWRAERGRNHPLVNVLFMALCACLCGADGFKAMARFARRKRRFFVRVLGGEVRAPSTDTFRRVFGALCPHAFEKVFRELLSHLQASLKGEVVALDGKTLKGALKAAGGGALHMLHAWASEQRLLLGSVAVEGAPGEVGALPALIRSLEGLEDAIVTVDANGCTREVAEAVREKKAHYVQALKGNRGPLHQAVCTLFVALAWQGRLPQGERRHHSQLQTHHGRLELREAWALDVQRLGLDWPGLVSAVLVHRQRYLTPGAPPEEDWHVYISSLEAHAPRLSRAIRQHWGVENELHWVLDVAFHEDSRQVRHQTAAENLGRLCRFTLALLQRDTSVKAGIALKRQEAGWSNRYLLKLLTVRPS